MQLNKNVKQPQQYKVHNTVFPNIEEATYYVSMLSKKAQATATISPYTAPTKASKKLNVVRNMLVRDMLEWAGEFTQSMSPSTEYCWMYSVEDNSGFSDAGDTWYEDLEDVSYGNNLEWDDAQHDYQSAVDNFSCLFGSYNEYDTPEKLSDMLNTMYHTMSDHSSETDTYICEIRSSIQKMCEGNPNISHSYDHPSRTTTISFSGNVDAMYDGYMLERNS